MGSHIQLFNLSIVRVVVVFTVRLTTKNNVRCALTCAQRVSALFSHLLYQPQYMAHFKSPLKIDYQN
ncbi:hypothetical protein SBF1_3090005 [Candidatus Desulfosporosinus infrequens]|uniref:Uncharacterized protein n=1 Tax=Candidatus Desulfosporosinus infrequens TaxID=2043169 RepID=A0A2U3KXT4_9FIRM|nr:hypothetical protein SBF1_3090005 [Candidatus Desulfosporosinus infrequens]